MDGTSERIVKLEHRVETLEDRLTKSEESRREIYERLNSLERDRAANSVVLGQIKDSIDEVKADVKYIKEKPGRRIDTVIMAALAAVGGALGGYVMSRIFGG